jgi:16S rRNA (guanine966-N2)-methyltransferase
VRIIAGAWRGRPIAAPEGRATRPTSDRAREGLFSMLASRLGSFEGLHVADLFAGSGALGLEALSRGAAFCTFVDSDRAAIEAIRRNLDRLGAADRAAIRQTGAEHASPPPRPCDLVMLDPPYASGLAEPVLRRLADPAWLAPAGWVSIESEAAQPPPQGFRTAAERRFGKAYIHLFHRGG